MKRRRRSIKKRNRQRLGRSRKAAQAVTASRVRGFGPALTPPVGFSFALVGPGDLLAVPLRPLVSGATDSVGRENRAAHRRSHRL
jgi:hypothetical protein